MARMLLGEQSSRYLVSALLWLVWFVLRQQPLSESGRPQRVMQSMPSPLTFTLKVPAVITMGVWLQTKLVRPCLCLLVGRFVRQCAVVTLPLCSTL